MDSEQLAELKALKAQNARLKQLLADAELAKAILKDVAEGNFEPRPESSWCCHGELRRPPSWCGYLIEPDFIEF
jgi:hypothetical protein